MCSAALLIFHCTDDQAAPSEANKDANPRLNSDSWMLLSRPLPNNDYGKPSFAICGRTVGGPRQLVRKAGMDNWVRRFLDAEEDQKAGSEMYRQFWTSL
ncbi:hypothetical protein BC829DRAFT_444236 [Chytridium lagenaria]|nr:hypothetical protein BC829DRAFT_444236 [Chytridium lagenaria]